jgi:UDP-N-acetylmuramate dehydrogenase
MSPAGEESRIEANVPLAPRTTIGVGGPARWFTSAVDEDGLREALAWRRANDLELFVLGGGSNIVVSDRGFDGMVIEVGLRGIHCTERNGGVLLRVGAGEQWDDVVDYAVTRGLAGIECLSGIPGRVGAAPIQNVGAYGQEVAETIVRVDAMSRDSGETVAFSGETCGFGYRDSVFKRAEKDRWIVTAVTFSLDRNRPPAIRYRELERALVDAPEPTLAAVRQAVLRLRRAKGMVIDPLDPDSRSVGSFFVNPVVEDSTLDRLAHLAKEQGIDLETIPRFPAGGGTKLSAAWLIEHAGFAKGTRRGSAAISSKHALAIINPGEATASSIRELADEIRESVRVRFGVFLEPEPAFVGW